MTTDVAAVWLERECCIERLGHEGKHNKVSRGGDRGQTVQGLVDNGQGFDLYCNLYPGLVWEGHEKGQCSCQVESG